MGALFVPLQGQQRSTVKVPTYTIHFCISIAQYIALISSFHKLSLLLSHRQIFDFINLYLVSKLKSYQFSRQFIVINTELYIPLQCVTAVLPSLSAWSLDQKPARA